MSTSRIALLLFAALVLIGQSAASKERNTFKYRVELNSGERFVLSSGALTSDSLTGMTGSGTRSVPVQSIRALERSEGTHGTTLGLIGGGLGFTYIMVGWMQAESDANSDPFNRVDDSKDAHELFGFTIGGALIGIAVGSIWDKWESVPVRGSVGYLPEKREVRFQLSLAI